MVSWNWKFLAEQDAIWMPKCVRYGWYLPYAPSSKEYGTWKFHYLACMTSLQVEAPSQDVVSTLNTS